MTFRRTAATRAVVAGKLQKPTAEAIRWEQILRRAVSKPGYAHPAHASCVGVPKRRVRRNQPACTDRRVPGRASDAPLERPDPAGRRRTHGRQASGSRRLDVYYPAVANGSHVEYYPGLAGLENAAETRILRLQFGGVWNAVTSGTIRTNAYAAPPMPPGRTKFPVLIFSPGGQAPVLAYQLQLEELASHGYVIFALEHGTDSALIIRPDRTMIPYVSRRPPDPLPTVAYLEAVRDEAIRRTADIVFTLNQISLLAKQPGSVLHNRLDLSRIGVFGHSAGGQAAVRTCQIDARVRACLNQDGEMFGIAVGSTEPVPTVLPGKPTLAPVADIYVAEPLASDAQLAAVNVTRKQFEDWRAAKNRALRGFLHQNSRESYLITITAPGYAHGTFMDIRLLTPNPDPQATLEPPNRNRHHAGLLRRPPALGRAKELVPIRHRTRQRNRGRETRH